MSNVTRENAPIYSMLADDPDLYEIVMLFVNEMPTRINQLLNKFHEKNWDELEQTAHQLRGAAGGYGFGEVTPAAGKLEQSIKDRLTEEEIQQSLVELIELCRRMDIQPR